LEKNRVISSKREHIFSIFIPNRRGEIVVAMLLPNTIPILELNVNIFELISVMVSIIIAELDWINIVEINPVKKDFENDFVRVENLLFISFIEVFIREVDIFSRE
jgi:hypothetical protein